MRAYSIDLRERIVDAVASGQPLATTARRFAVSVKTVQRLVVRQRDTGSVAPRPIPGLPRRIGPAEAVQLQARMQAMPDATVLKNCAWWAEVSEHQVSEPTMWRAMHRLGWTHKKKPSQQANVMRRREPTTVRRLLNTPPTVSCSWMKVGLKRI